uniref:Uncharacterized protein n=1 Tax=Cacopsylla melanoneura TaxID=428564 RepID=A0A8D8RC97_9HEMI
MYLGWEEIFIGNFAEQSVANFLDYGFQGTLNSGHQLLDDVSPVLVQENVHLFTQLFVSVEKVFQLDVHLLNLGNGNEDLVQLDVGLSVLHEGFSAQLLDIQFWVNEGDVTVSVSNNREDHNLSLDAVLTNNLYIVVDVETGRELVVVDVVFDSLNSCVFESNDRGVLQVEINTDWPTALANV